MLYLNIYVNIGKYLLIPMLYYTHGTRNTTRTMHFAFSAANSATSHRNHNLRRYNRGNIQHRFDANGKYITKGERTVDNRCNNLKD